MKFERLLKEGGTAYPFASGQMSFEGMTLRDWFAGQALTAMINKRPDDDGWDETEVAIDCYVMADAMLRRREAKT